MIRERALSGSSEPKGPMLVSMDFDRERHALVPWRMSADMAGQDRAVAACKSEQTWGFKSGTNKAKQRAFFAAR